MTRARHLQSVASSACAAVCALCVCAAVPRPLAAQTQVTTIDAFDSTSAWRAAPASGVEMQIGTESGHTGNAMKVSFDFHGGGGWAAFRRETRVTLPENYEISFWIKGDAPRNTLEFKLVDATGDNVWWVNRPEFEFSGDWRRITFRKRHVTFAWGPLGGGDIRNVAAVEFAVTAGTGGKGTVWIDDLTVTPRDPVRDYTATPVISRTANTWTMDFTQNREFGGILIDWTSTAKPRSYDVQTSMDATSWQTVRSVIGGRRMSDYLQLPEAESRYVRIASRDGMQVDQIRDVRVMPIQWGASRNDLFRTIATDAPRGAYPKYFTGTQSYWTVVGENGDPREAMINEEGGVEVDKRSFSLEPFLMVNDRLVTWADAHITQSLHAEYLPIPSVTWQADSVLMRETVWVDRSVLWLKYVVTNQKRSRQSTSLILAVRPFQVNPLSQFLNHAGGFAPISRIEYVRDDLTVDSQRVRLVTTPASVRLLPFDQGDVVDYARTVRPLSVDVTSSGLHDENRAASAALTYPLALAPGESREVFVAVPFTAATTAPVTTTEADGNRSLDAAVTKWHADLDRFRVLLPAQLEDLARSLQTNLAYILINRDNDAIQPGSRSYERSWIRDGSLTSAALLRLGHEKEVRAFIEWYAPFQYADGKVPCCVDSRGADPVPENDSHGELIYLITEYVRFTHDTAFARRMWPHVNRAVTYMDSLRSSRRSAQYVNTEFYGLMPQSISHEGYSAKPMHSYWDDSFALKGYKDAAWLAAMLHIDTTRFVRSRDEFQHDLMQSLNTAMTKRNIDFLPGAAELGDFDATSTTVALNPGGAQRDLPQAALLRTFDKYWDDFVARRDGNRWEGYTPYEWRVVGTLLRLGQKQRAYAVLDWFMQHQRPDAWNHWAEVVYRDRDAQHFIGDMPHTWVGSDFIRSALDMFVYDDNGAVIIAAGVMPSWITAQRPVGIHGIRTAYGIVGYEMTRRGVDVVLKIDAGAGVPPAGFIIRSPLDRPIRSALADGHKIDAVSLNSSRGMEVTLKTLPRELILKY